MNCQLCRAPAKLGWYDNVPGIPPGSFRYIEVGSWIALVACPQCDVRWIERVTGPHGTIMTMVRWPFEDQDFRVLHDHDNGTMLHAWHEASGFQAAIQEELLKGGILILNRRLRALRRAAANLAEAPTTDELKDFLTA